MQVIDIKTKGRAVTRNGEFDVGAIKAELTKDGKAKIGFVSSRLHRSLHSGATIEAEAMDKLAMSWAQQRGLLSPRVPTSGELNAIRLMKQAVAALEG